MSAPLPCFDLIHQMENTYSYCVALADHARTHGMKAAVRAFQTTVPTVRKWLRRFQGPDKPGRVVRTARLWGAEGRARLRRALKNKAAPRLRQRSNAAKSM